MGFSGLGCGGINLPGLSSDGYHGLFKCIEILLFVDFIRNFIPIDILKNIDSSDIEDVTERLLSLVSEQKDGDTIKRIQLKGV